MRLRFSSFGAGRDRILPTPAFRTRALGSSDFRCSISLMEAELAIRPQLCRYQSVASWRIHAMRSGRISFVFLVIFSFFFAILCWFFIYLVLRTSLVQSQDRLAVTVYLLDSLRNVIETNDIANDNEIRTPHQLTVIFPGGSAISVGSRRTFLMVDIADRESIVDVSCSFPTRQCTFQEALLAAKSFANSKLTASESALITKMETWGDLPGREVIGSDPMDYRIGSIEVPNEGSIDLAVRPDRSFGWLCVATFETRTIDRPSMGRGRGTREKGEREKGDTTAQSRPSDSGGGSIRLWTIARSISSCR